jgi:hypothetical protein
MNDTQTPHGGRRDAARPRRHGGAPHPLRQPVAAEQPTYGSAHRYDTDLYASTGLLHAIYDHADPDGDGDRAGGDGDPERAADAGAEDGGADLRRDADEAAGRYGDADRHRPGHRA